MKPCSPTSGLPVATTVLFSACSFSPSAGKNSWSAFPSISSSEMQREAAPARIIPLRKRPRGFCDAVTRAEAARVPGLCPQCLSSKMDDSLGDCLRTRNEPDEVHTGPSLAPVGAAPIPDCSVFSDPLMTAGNSPDQTAANVEHRNVDRCGTLQSILDSCRGTRRRRA